MSMPVLEIVDVTKRFSGAVALDRVSFDLRAGEVHALVGENGAGKSTLINIVSGLLQPDEGTVLLDGRVRRLADPSEARAAGIATVHQESDVFGTLSIAESLAIFRGLPVGRFGFVNRREIERWATEAASTLREPIDPRRPAGGLPLGRRQLIQAASAAASGASVLLLDEPTSSFSADECDWLFDRIARLKSEGVGIIYISHRAEEIERLADRITVLRDGRVSWSGAAASLDRSGMIRAMVGRDRETAVRRGSLRNIGGGTPALRTVGLSDAEGRFRDVTLEVFAGEILGIYGLVGAGRSEWAQAVFGLRGVSSGRVELRGNRVNIKAPATANRVGIAYLPEDRLRQAIFAGLSIRENTTVGALRSLSLGPFLSSARERAVTLRIVKSLDVKHRFIEQPIKQLSGGNQQKIVFGRLNLIKPSVLIVDEPTRGVDVGAKAEIHRLLRAIADDGRGVVLISSDLPEVLENADRIAVFRDGEVAARFDAADSTPEQVAGVAVTGGDSIRRGSFDKKRVGPRVRLASELGLAAAVAILSLALALTTRGRFATASNLIGVVDNAAVLTILAFGSAAVIIARGIDISVGSLLALSAASTGLVLKSASVSDGMRTPLAIVAGLSVGLAGGLLNAGAALAGGVHPVVVTLGTMTIFRGLMLLLTGGEVIGALPDDYRALANARLLGLPGSIWVLAFSAAIVHAWLSRTISGRHIYAFGCNPVAARIVGISKTRVWLTAFGVGGLTAALAGLLELGQNGSMQSVLGQGYELRAIAAAVIGGTAVTGGRGGVIGVLLGSILLSLSQNALVLWEVSRYRYDLVLGGLLLLAIGLDLALRRLVR